MHERQNKGALGREKNEWNPEKFVIGEFGPFVILKSDPGNSQHNTIQFSIQKRESVNNGELIFENDLLRVDSYQEGYFSAVWHSKATIGKFLDQAEKFLTKFEPLPKLSESLPTPDENDERYSLFIFSREKNPMAYHFGRPLSEKDLETEGIITKKADSTLSLIRIETPYADFCYEPEEKRVAILATISPSDKSRVIKVAAEFVANTQEVMPFQIVLNALSRLPYLNQPHPTKTPA